MVNVRQLARAKLISERKRSSGSESEGGPAIIEGPPLVLGTRREGDGEGGGTPRADKRRKVAVAAKTPVPNLSLEDDDQVRLFTGSVFYCTAPAFPSRLRLRLGMGLELGIRLELGLRV